MKESVIVDSWLGLVSYHTLLLACKKHKNKNKVRKLYDERKKDFKKKAKGMVKPRKKIKE